MPRTDRLSGHTLRYEGAPFDDRGQWLHPYQHSGEGRGKCSCGALSEVLPSAAQRKQWHRDHKADVRTAAGKALP